jgi:hypothetical protein
MINLIVNAIEAMGGASGRPHDDAYLRRCHSGGVARVVAAFAAASSIFLLQISALLWVASFLLFASTYRPILVSPRIDEGKRIT